MTYPRPFLQFWDQLEKMEAERKQGKYNKSAFTMLKAFIEVIGEQNFI